MDEQARKMAIQKGIAEVQASMGLSEPIQNGPIELRKTEDGPLTWQLFRNNQPIVFADSFCGGKTKEEALEVARKVAGKEGWEVDES